MDMEEGGMNVHYDPFPSFVPPPPYPPSAGAWADLSSIVEESGREHQPRRDDLMKVASIIAYQQYSFRTRVERAGGDQRSHHASGRGFMMASRSTQ
jgi:hypothetical protein